MMARKRIGVGVRLIAVVLCGLGAGGAYGQGVRDLRVVGLFGDRAVVVVDGQRQLLGPGETSPEGVRLLSVDGQGAMLELDGQARHYRLGDRAGTRFAQADRDRVTLYKDAQGMFTTSGTINGSPVRFLVDTGASAVAMDVTQARRLGIDYEGQGTGITVRTAAGLARAYRVRLDLVKVGGVVQRNLEAFVVEGDKPGFILLGMSYLRRFRIENDGRVMHLEKRY